MMLTVEIPFITAPRVEHVSVIKFEHIVHVNQVTTCASIFLSQVSSIEILILMY